MPDRIRDVLGRPPEGGATGRADALAQPDLPRRFYERVEVAPRERGYAVLLDGRPVRTPARRPLELPATALAGIVAGEWRAQADHIDPATMPMTRLVNSAIDGVADRRAAVADDIVRFSGSDLLCYRAEAPDGLVVRQAALWDPVLAWAREDLGARFVLAQGIIFVDQPPEAIDAIAARVKTLADPFALAGVHVMTTLTGSAILALAVAERAIDAETAWQAAHVDEDWNMAQWGEDGEAMARRARRWREMQAAALLAAETAGLRGGTAG